MSELTMTCQPIENLSLQNCKDFFIRKDGILHNGINVNVPASIRNIADGKIVAMRLTDDYTQVNSIKSYDEIYETFLAGNNLNDKFFQDINLIKNTTTSSNTSNSDDKFYYTKKIDKKKKFYYSINEKLEDYDKIEALYFLNEIISNNFVLLEHEIQKINGDKIKFFSLYNHLAPLGRMTVAQKLQLFWYEHKITMKTSKYPCCKVGSNYIPCELQVDSSPPKEGYCNIKWSLNGKNYSGKIAESYLNNLGEIGSESHQKQKNNQVEYKDGIPVFKTHDGNNPSRRTLQEIVDVKTLFEFDDFQEIVKYNNKIPLKVRYDKNKEGYIYLNEKLEYNKSDWDDSIKKFYNVIGKEEEIKFLNFQIKVCLKKDFNTKDQVFTPSKTEVNKGTKIGFSGFNFMEKDKLADNVVILKDGEPKPFTVHIETFFPDDSELNFNYNNENKWEPFYLQVNSEYQACTEKPTTETTTSSDLYKMSLIELLGEEKLFSDEIFYKIKVIADIKKNNSDYINHTNGEYAIWTQDGVKYTAGKKNPVPLYSRDNIKRNYTTTFYNDFYYLCYNEGILNLKDKKNTKLRLFRYFYTPVLKEYYIKQSDFDSFKKDTDNEPASKIYIKAKEGKHFFIKTQLDNTNLFSRLSKKVGQYEKIQGSIKRPIKLEFQEKKINEYEHLSTYNCKDIWLKTKSSNNKVYWIKQSDIKSEKNGTPIEVLSYNDWSKNFEVLDLKDKKSYKIKDFTNDNISKKTKALRDSFNNKKYPISENVMEIIFNEHFERNFIFEHKNEWDASKQLIESYSNKSKAEKVLKEYEFFSSIKQQIKTDIFFYVHPFYFIKQLDQLLSIPDINPYIIDGQPVHHEPRITGATAPKNANDPEYYFRTNIGFATGSTEIDNEKFISTIHYNINDIDYYFPKLNCPCGYSYAYWDELKSDGTHKPHSGIDLTGKVEFWKNGKKNKTVDNLPIISFINGEVWGVKWHKSYGNMLFIKHRYSSMLYLLAHLKKDGIKVKEGQMVKPGQIVALAGNSGSGGNTTHLHLEVFDVGNKTKEQILKIDSTLGWVINNPSDYRRDPLDNTVKYNDLLEKSKKRLGL